MSAEIELGTRPSSRFPSSAALRQYCDQLLDLVARLGDRLALVERQRVREALAAPLDLVGDAVHRGRPLERARASPALGGPVRRGDRPLRVLAASLRTSAIASPVAGDSA